MPLATSTPLPTLLFAAVATLAVTGCSVQLDLNDDTTRRIENETVPAASLTGIEVTTENGALEIVPGAGDEVAIRVVLQEKNEGDADYTVDTDGDRLVVVGECDGRAWNGCSVGFVLTVPEGFDVTADSDNGRVTVEGVTGAIDIETDNGAIDGDGLASPSVNARTNNGRIQLIFDAAPDMVDATTDNGAIAVRVPDDGTVYDVDADSDNGSVDVDVKTDADADSSIVVESDNGSIDVEYRRS